MDKTKNESVIDEAIKSIGTKDYNKFSVLFRLIVGGDYDDDLIQTAYVACSLWAKQVEEIRLSDISYMAETMKSIEIYKKIGMF